MMSSQPPLQRDPDRELQGPVILLGTIYAVFLLAIILINLGWL